MLIQVAWARSAPSEARIAGSAMATTEPSMNPIAEARIAAARIHLRLAGSQKDGAASAMRGAGCW